MTTETVPTAPADGAAPETLPEGTAQVEATEATDEAAADTTGSGDDSTTDSKDDAKAEADKAQRKTQRRIDRLIAEKSAAQQRVRDLEAAAEARAKAAEQDDDGTKRPAEDPREIARTMRIVEKTAEATARVMKEAGKKYADFEAAIADLVSEVGPQIDAVGRPSPLMQAVLDSDRAADVLYYLGKNDEVAAELVGLSPAQIGRRIARIENELAAKATPKPSAAAKPLTPVRASATPTVDPSKMSDKEWAKWNREQRQRA